MRLENHLNITYEQYCDSIDNLMSVDEGIGDVLGKGFRTIKDELVSIADNLGIGAQHIIHAFKTLDAYHLMKAIGFNIKTLLKAVHALAQLVRGGIFKVFKELHTTGAFQKIRSGALELDKILEQYPILKKLTGPAVAGLLFFIWTQMTFIGNLDYDFDFGNIAKALAGNFSIEQLFASPEGMMLTALFATGGLISVPWLGGTIPNLVLAITYTLMKHKGVELSVIKKVRSSIHLERI